MAETNFDREKFEFFKGLMGEDADRFVEQFLQNIAELKSNVLTFSDVDLQLKSHKLKSSSFHLGAPGLGE